jgi:peptide-methionine (S)-S-oxide reductase
VKKIKNFLAILGISFGARSQSHPNSYIKISNNNLNTMTTQKTDTADIAGGCFWCVEAIFNQLKGVQSVTSGYSGGKIANPTYREVCSGLTGHAESVQIVFSPDTISYENLLKIFFTVHNPTTLNRQGADAGTQYRSAIFYRNDEQKAIAEKVIKEVTDEKIWNDPIVTEVTPFKNFYKAEDYHQDYFANNENQPYCQIVIEPKVAKFRKAYLDLLKK